MCTGAEPLLMLAQGAGAVAGAAGAYGSSKANAAAYNAQSQIAANNMQLAQWQADDAIQRGQVTASDAGIKANQLKGAQRARLASNGVDVTYGSAADILDDTDYFTAIDRARITDTAARDAWGYRATATEAGANSELLRSRADVESPFLAAGLSLIGSAGRVSPQWYSRSDPRSTFAAVDYQKRRDY